MCRKWGWHAGTKDIEKGLINCSYINILYTISSSSSSATTSSAMTTTITIIINKLWRIPTRVLLSWVAHVIPTWVATVPVTATGVKQKKQANLTKNVAPTPILKATLNTNYYSAFWEFFSYYIEVYNFYCMHIKIMIFRLPCGKRVTALSTITQLEPYHRLAKYLHGLEKYLASVTDVTEETYPLTNCSPRNGGWEILA